MGKFYKILLLSCFFALTSFNLYSQQINLIRFNNSASYTPGSGVSVIINPTGVFDLNNQFVLELSNAGGTFTSPTVLNTLNEFYLYFFYILSNNHDSLTINTTFNIFGVFVVQSDVSYGSSLFGNHTRTFYFKVFY